MRERERDCVRVCVSLAVSSSGGLVRFRTNTGLFEITVGILTNCHTQHTCDRSMFFFYLIEQHSKFLLHNLTGALYVHPL